MVNFHFKSLLPILLTIVALLSNFRLTGQQDTIIYNGCPSGGKKIKKIFDQLSIDDAIRHKPINISGQCTASNKKYPFKVFWIKTTDIFDLKIVTEGDVSISIYNGGQFDPNVTCNSIKNIDPNQEENLYIYSQEAFFAVVVHAAVLNNYPKFEISFDHEVALYDENCFVRYDCISDSFSIEKLVPVFLTSIKDQVRYDNHVKILAGGQQKFLTKTYKIDGKTIGQSEHPVFYNKINDFPELLDIEVSCQQIDHLAPELLHPYLQNKLGDRLAYLANYPYLINKSGQCTQLFYSYSDQVINASNSASSLGILRTYQILDWSNGDQTTRSQKITIINDQKVIIQKLQKITSNVPAWNCYYQLDFPTPELYSDCKPNIQYLKIFDEDGKEITKNEGIFETSFLKRGQYKFYYVYDDHINLSDKSILEVEIIKNTSNHVPFILYLENNEPRKISQENFSEYITDNCVQYDEIKLLNEPKTACDTINDGSITLCCDMVKYPDQVNTYAMKLQKLGLDSLDNITVIDSTIIYTQFIVKQNFTEIICPRDSILDCHATDISPELLGFATAKGSCFNVQLEQYIDNTVKLNDLHTIIYRTFKNIASRTNLQTCRQKIILECTSETNELSPSQTFNIIPNPVTDRFIIKSTNSSLITHIVIKTMTGSQVFTTQFQQNSHSVDVSNLPSGIYLIEIFDGNAKVGTNRIVKL